MTNKRPLDDQEETLTPITKDSAITTAATAAFKRPKVSTSSRSNTNSGLPEAFSRESIIASAERVVQEVGKAAAVDLSSILKDAKVHYLTKDKASWIYYIPKWYRRIYKQAPVIFDAGAGSSLTYSQWFEKIWNLHPKHYDTIKMFGKDVPTPRFQQGYGVDYRFSGNTFVAKLFPPIMLPAVQLMQGLVMNPETNKTYLNMGLTNWYANGDHYVGPHSDSETQLFRGSPVLALSLGATRKFFFTPKKPTTSTLAGGEGSRLELMLNDGDLLVMGGTTQFTHKHALPKMKKCAGKRISITLRCYRGQSNEKCADYKLSD